jgi:hypothetical protein
MPNHAPDDGPPPRDLKQCAADQVWLIKREITMLGVGEMTKKKAGQLEVLKMRLKQMEVLGGL